MMPMQRHTTTVVPWFHNEISSEATSCATTLIAPCGCAPPLQTTSCQSVHCSSHPVFLRFGQLYLSRARECISHCLTLKILWMGFPTSQPHVNCTTITQLTYNCCTTVANLMNNCCTSTAQYPNKRYTRIAHVDLLYRLLLMYLLSNCTFQ